MPKLHVLGKKLTKCIFLFLLLGSGAYKHCTESFLFSLVNPTGAGPTKLPLKGTSNQNGILCNSGYGPTFGAGHDLHVANVANTNANSHSNLNSTYESPPHVTPTTFLASNRNFVVNEVEVFVFRE